MRAGRGDGQSFLDDMLNDGVITKGTKANAECLLERHRANTAQNALNSARSKSYVKWVDGAPTTLEQQLSRESANSRYK